MSAARLVALSWSLALLATGVAHAQTVSASGQSSAPPIQYFGGKPPVMDNASFGHVLLEQLEDRWNGSDHSFRYDGQGWYGTDYDKVWVKSEGQVDGRGRFADGQHEVLYDRATSTFLDLQAGIRIDADSGPTRAWAALGVQGLAVYFFDVEATAYASDRGVAARLKASYDLLITQRLILQPEAEVNFYSASDRGRGTGSGLSDIDAGLRLRYEISRKSAPYIGVSYQGRFGQSADFARKDNESTSDARFTFGVRAWF
ncbi:MAG: copper resistance protein CopB [Rhodospirillales bacterium]|nr:copper resistance protein CopB [Rhodospirillales bacterium]